MAEMARVSDDEARAIRSWLDVAGMTFHTGTDEATELTDAQLLSQFKMYISALRMSDDFGLDAVGIQYQQGLKDVVPASDLAEGLLNNVERPPSAAVTGPVFSTRSPASPLQRSRRGCRSRFVDHQSHLDRHGP